VSDNQSENSASWGPGDAEAHEACARAVEVAAAEREVQAAEELVWSLEEQLKEAKRQLIIAEGRVHLARLAPKRHQVLTSSVNHNRDQLYTYCMQLGYQFALLNGKVHYAGRPGEGLMNTGASLEDLLP
jgi:hypothetical protein